MNGKTYPQAARNAYINTYVAKNGAITRLSAARERAADALLRGGRPDFEAEVARLEIEVSQAVTASRLALEQLRQAEADFY